MKKKELNKGERTKKAILECLEKSLGVVTTACKMAGVSRSLFYKYYHSDEKFKNAVKEIEDVALDFTESQLFVQIGEGNMAGIIWHLKTKGKHRGWVERIENVHTVKDELQDLSDEELRQRYKKFKSLVNKK